eukprot:3362247-Pleurochrysis_carterae.AAC.1
MVADLIVCLPPCPTSAHRHMPFTLGTARLCAAIGKRKVFLHSPHRAVARGLPTRSCPLRAMQPAQPGS